MLSFLKFVSHKLVLIKRGVIQTTRLAFGVCIHSRGSTTLDNSASQGVIKSNGLWISVRGLGQGCDLEYATLGGIEEVDHVNHANIMISPITSRH